MRDRVVVGFISGFLASVGADIVNWILFGFNFSEIRFLDWASIVFLGHLPGSTTELIVTQVTQMLWDSLLGVLFVLLIPTIDSDYLYFKGIMYSFTLLLVFRAISVLFNIPYLNNLPMQTFLASIICSVVWGILAAFFIRRYIASEYRR